MPIVHGGEYRSSRRGVTAVLVLTVGAGLAITAAQRPPAEPATTAPQLVLQTGHARSVRALAFSPDGRWLASGGDDHQIRLWDVATGAVVQTLKGHAASVRTIVFSPDGKLLASGSDDHTSIIWDPGSGEELRRFVAPRGPIESLAFSPDGERLAAGSGWGSAVWEIATGRLAEALRRETARGELLAFDGDGQSLLLLGGEGRHIAYWRFATGKVSRQVPLDGDGPGARWPSNVVRSLLVLGKADDALFRRGLTTLIASVTVFWAGTQMPMVLSPDGTLLAARDPSVNHSTRLWHVESARPLQSLPAEAAAATALAFSPDSRLLAVAPEGRQGRITVWDVVGGVQQRELGRPAEPIHQVLFFTGKASDALSVITGTAQGPFHIWDRGGVRRLRTAPGTNYNYQLCSGVDGAPLLVAAPFNGEETLFIDPQSDTVVQRIRIGQSPAGAWALSPDGHLLAYTTPSDIADGISITVREFETGRELHTFVSDSRLDGLAFSRNNRVLLATSLHDAPATVWDLASGDKRQRFEGRSFALSPDGTWLASHADTLPHTVTLTHLLSGATRTIQDRASMTFSPGGRYLATGADGGISVWDLKTQRRMLLARFSSWSTGFKSFCPDDRCILIGSTAQSVQLWDIASGRELIPGLGTMARYGSHAFSADMRWLAVSSPDGGLGIWDINAGTLAAVLYVVNGGTSWLVTTPAGFFDASDEHARSLIGWNVGMDVEASERLARERFRPGLLPDVLSGRHLGHLGLPGGGMR